MQNYFNYFTEIEERFQQRRGSLLMLSTLDWALIDTWREAGVPLAAVLRGVDAAFDKHDAKAAGAGGRRVRKVNGLAWAAQSVMEEAQLAAKALVGVAQADERETGFEHGRVAAYLQKNASTIERAGVSGETVTRLRELATGLAAFGLEQLDRTLGVLEEKLFAAVLVATSEADLVSLRAEAARELVPYRGKMQAVQIRQVEQQILQKRLLEARGLPRLSLFYMSLGEG